MSAGRHGCGAGFSRAIFFIFLFPLLAAATDWPQFRGPGGRGTSTDRIVKQWTGSVTNPIWLVHLSNSLSSLVVSEGRVVTQARRVIGGVDQEICVALDAADGRELWATPVEKIAYPDFGVGTDDGPRSTPSIAGDSVYVLTSYLNLHRLNITNGAVIWSRDLLTLYGGTVIDWQNAASPLVDDDAIYVNANCGTSTLLSLRTADGGLHWRSQDEPMTHSTPVLATIHGVRQVLFATQHGVVSLHPATGDRLWKAVYPFAYGYSLSIMPVIYDDMVFVCGAHAYGMRATVMQVHYTQGTWSTTRLWSTNNPTAHWMTPVCHQGFLFGPFGIQSFDSVNAQLKCIEMRTGTVRWSRDGFGRGATLLVDGSLMTITERGQLVLCDPSVTAYAERGRFTAIPFYHGTTNKCWNAPAVANGRVYVRSTAYVAAYDLSLPPLRFDGPASIAPGTLQLAVRTVDGSPIKSNRVSSIETWAATNLTLPFTQWVKLTNAPMFSNGTVFINDVPSGSPSQRFFLLRELP